VSGFAGIVSLDGAPVDAALLARMAAGLERRAPHGGGVRVLPHCGLAHALLRTGDEADPPAGPFSLDGAAWIVADARIDARDALARALRSAGEEARPDDPAAELILRAYRAWDTECVHRLLGDWAFAIHDGPRRRLFCARDALGVKPLFHAAPPGSFVFSSSLDAVLLHPHVDAGVDDEAMADWLVHSYLHDPGRTIRRGVRRLPPGHALVLEGDGRLDLRRWWEMPRDPPVRRRPAEHAEAFVSLLGDAVRDRLPQGAASIFLSGGRDSPAVAILAREAIRGGERNARLAGFTAFYQRLIPDDEPRFARMAAEAAEVPVTWLAVDGYQPFQGFEADPLLARPEPVESPLMAIEVDQWRQAVAHAPVLLTGLGGDPLLRESPSRLTRLAARGRLLRALWEAGQYAGLHRRLPRPGVRTWLRARNAPATPRVSVPEWIDPGFARRVDLAERVAAQNARRAEPHPLRPDSWEQLSSPFWAHVFSYYDPGVTGLPLEVRHPFFDLRLIRLVLAVPPAQWYNDKGLLRIGMRGRLPEPLLRRPKTPLRGDPFAVRLREQGEGWLGGRTLGPEVEPWIRVARVPRIVGGRGEGVPAPLWPHLRPLGLSLWLRRMGIG
jgi:asparagine synthase (glutamine-hydrolysing)